MSRARLSLALALALAPLATPASAGPLDRDTPACALARAVPTDGNIEACTGEPIDLRAVSYVFLATSYADAIPAVYVLDADLSGAGCIARMESGVTVSDVLAIIDAQTPHQLDLSQAVLSCEFDMGD